MKVRHKEFTSLQEKFDKSQWALWALRPSPYRIGDAVRSHPSDGPAETERDLADDASASEALECMALLNCVRWMCGLSAVYMGPDLWHLCSTVSQVLMPRAAGSRTGDNLGPAASFAQDLCGVLRDRQESLAVFHCEGSLVAAIHESLTATHLTDEPGEGPQDDPQRMAAALSERIKTRGLDRDEQDKHPHRRVNYRVAHMVIGGTRKMLSASDLPQPLLPLRLLWDLDERGVPREAAEVQARANAAAVVAVAPARGGRAHRATRLRRQGVPAGAARAPGKIASMWGDQRGALNFRRLLLNPALSEFGAGRSRDTCVMCGEARSEPPWPSKRGHPDAVCYPPAGVVPLELLAGCRAPWSIMPDSTRFQPTAEIKVCAWSVRIERAAGRPWAADRLDEVAVRGQAVDCSAKGEPFCVFFWPDLSLSQATCGVQLEVVLSGLRGPASQLTFFYDVQPVLQEVCDAQLCSQAASLRSILGDHSLWHRGLNDARAPSPPNREERSDAPASPAPPIGDHQSLVDDEGNWQGQVPFELVSHKHTAITTKVVDLAITLRCDRVAALRADLVIIRYGGDEEAAPRATQVQKLWDSYFLVRVKLPMSRCRYQLRFQASPLMAPEQLQDLVAPVYTIIAEDSCQTLLSSMDDPHLKKFGLAQVMSAAHRHGVVLLAPLTHRIIIGQCYFLVYVDREFALEQARSAQQKAQGAVLTGLRTEPHERSPEECAPRCGPQAPATTLFSRRLLPSRESRRRASKLASAAFPPDSAQHTPAAAALNPGPQPAKIAELHAQLQEYVEPCAQDAGGEVHLDLVMHGGANVHRLRERHDFPGFFEGVLSFAESEHMTAVRLFIRFPTTHILSYCPMEVAEWIVCRHEHFPMNF